MNEGVLVMLKSTITNRWLFTRLEKPDEWHGRWNGIAGSIAQGESPLEAATRKVAAVPDIIPAPLEFVCSIHGPQRTLHVFQGTYSGADPSGYLMYGEPLTNWSREPVVPTLRVLMPLVELPADVRRKHFACLYLAD